MWRNLRDIVAHTNTQAHAHTQAHTNTQAHAHTHTHVHRPRATPDQSNCRQPLSISYQWQPSGHVGDPSDCTPCTHMRVGCNSMRACARKLREAALPVLVRIGSPPKWAFRSRRPQKNDDVARVLLRRFMLKMRVSLETSSKKWDSRNSSNIQKWPFRSRRLRKNSSSESLF